MFDGVVDGRCDTVGQPDLSRETEFWGAIVDRDIDSPYSVDHKQDWQAIDGWSHIFYK